ncbi:MAG: hypothetical protein ACYDBB_18275 [Armatimonadota bacterium]
MRRILPGCLLVALLWVGLLPACAQDGTTPLPIATMRWAPEDVHTQLTWQSAPDGQGEYLTLASRYPVPRSTVSPRHKEIWHA